jgi:hypothetical protein
LGGKWVKKPTNKQWEKLLSIIDEKSQGSEFLTKIKDGYGHLLRIVENKAVDEDQLQSQFKWSSVKIGDAPAGTHYSLQGGQIHAGSGSTYSEVRILLFWTFQSEVEKPSYDADTQTTKLTLIMALADHIWANLGKKDLKLQMLVLIWHVYESCEESYKRTCRSTFSAYKNIPSLIDQFYDFPREKSPGQRKVVLNYIKGVLDNYEITLWKKVAQEKE